MIQYSKYALGRGYVQRQGRIVGESRCKTCWYIHWEGQSVYSRNKVFHKSLIERVPC